ncbi:unnamed protein product [Schistosoma turkestanicum]|nr:unnamed protein product [Schistosoma turkestanicum]
MSSYIYLSIFLINIILNGLASSLPEEYEAQVKNYPDIIQSKEKCLPQQGNYDFASTLVCDPDGLLTVAQKMLGVWNAIFRCRLSTITNNYTKLSYKC